MYSMGDFDKKDRRILLELDRNARQSYGNIAKKVHLSKSSVMNRIKELEKQGVILNYITVIDNMRLGYVNYVIYFKFTSTTPEKEKEIVKFLHAHPRVWGLVTTSGYVDLVVVLATKTTKEYYEIWETLYEKIKPYVKVIRTALLIEYINFSRNYLLPSEEVKKIEIFTGSLADERVDDTDNALLKELSQNARISIVDLSKKVHLTPSAIVYRIRQLEKRGIIQAYRANINFRKLGYEYFKIMLTLNDFSIRKDLYTWVKSNKNVVYFDGFIGGYDFEFDMEIEGFSEFIKFIEDMKEGFGECIEDIFYFQALLFHKATYYPE